MESAESLKEIVREKYGQLARDGGSCCGPTNCCGPSNGESSFVDFSEDYTKLEGYVADADLGLGCGIPTEAADLQPGQTVLDLGSGAGNDVFVAGSIVGETGRVIGVDMTPDMIRKARENVARLGYRNVEFRLGEIEALPVDAGGMDRVISNCVLNLVPDKRQAFSEIHRVLKPGGRFGISDVVLEGDFPEDLRKAAELYVGCVSGAMQKREYLDLIRQSGFQNVEVSREKTITLPDDLLAAYLSPEQRNSLDRSGMRILSVTVKGTKPADVVSDASEPCCLPAPKDADGKASGACCQPLVKRTANPE
ncbi:MAG: arsenite S-adenosylmethyltransferase [Fibrobacteres bacterium]|nr:arsenite S-adenosylmethyltransferase [Fibrobacterota bacterium]